MIKIISPDDFIKAANSGDIDEFCRTAAEKTYEKLVKLQITAKKTAVVAGDGITGGVAAYLVGIMQKNGCDVKVAFLSSDKAALSAAQAGNADAAFVNDKTFYSECDYLIDATYGCSSRQHDFNCFAGNKAAEIISLCAPYGVDAATGDINPNAVKSSLTLALGGIFVGLILGRAPDYIGRVEVVDISPAVKPCAFIADAEYVRPAKKLLSSHKGDNGKVSIIGGSDTMPGAPLMAYYTAAAASRCGAGLVRLCVGEREKCAYKTRVTEQTLFFLPEKDGYVSFDESIFSAIALWSDVIVLGPGMGKNPELPQMIRYFLEHCDKTLILDADALNCVATQPKILQSHFCRLIITPHIGEFKRLAPTVQPYNIEAVKKFAKEAGCVLVLKSARTIITDGDRVFVNVTGSPAQAKGGSGDMLSGAIAAFSVSNEPLRAAVSACYYMGIAAERAAESLHSDISVLSGDIIGQIENYGFCEYDGLVKNLIIEDLA